MNLYDVHVHTAEASKCSPQPGAEMAEEYHAKGYTGIIVTDHFLNGNTRVPADLPWKERLYVYLFSIRACGRTGKTDHLDVFFGWEASFEGNDFLTYGLDRQWLENHPELLSLSLTEYLNFVRQEGGTVVHAHPFRQGKHIPFIRLNPELVDGVEVRNHNRPDAENRRNLWYAETFDLPRTAGSDAHKCSQIPPEFSVRKHDGKALRIIRGPAPTHVDSFLKFKNREMEK